MKPAAAAPTPRWFGPVVFFAALLAFAPALGNALVDWDDLTFLVRNQAYRVWPGNLWWMATARMGGHYHPLTWLSYALDVAVWGLEPFGFHLTNLLLHGAAAWAFFEVGRRLVSPRAAFAAALLFAVHPLRAESVAWAAERRDVLSGLFYLLTIKDYLDGRRRRSLGFFACSLLSKAVGVTLPGALMLLDWYQGKKPDLRSKAPYFAMAFAALVVNAGTQSFNGALDGFAGYPLHHRLAATAYSLAFYPLKTLWPSGLIPIYEFPAALNPLAPRFALAFLFAAGVTAACWRLRRERPELLASWGFYALTLLPTIGLVRFGPQLVADRYSYLACLPFALLAGAGFERAEKKLPREALAAGGALLLLLGALSWRQCSFWKDTDAMWARVLSVAPDTAIAHHNLARRSDAVGNLDAAIAGYERALAIRPTYALAMNNLALAYARKGQAKPAEELFLRALAQKPDYWEARANLGLLRAGQGRFDEALEDLGAALALQPQRESLKRNLQAVARAAASAPRPKPKR